MVRTQLPFKKGIKVENTIQWQGSGRVIDDSMALESNSEGSEPKVNYVKAVQ